jgi:hypothetical protein
LDGASTQTKGGEGNPEERGNGGEKCKHKSYLFVSLNPTYSTLKVINCRVLLLDVDIFAPFLNSGGSGSDLEKEVVMVANPAGHSLDNLDLIVDSFEDTSVNRPKAVV